jgi:hypothetical protein
VHAGCVELALCSAGAVSASAVSDFLPWWAQTVCAGPVAKVAQGQARTLRGLCAGWRSWRWAGRGVCVEFAPGRAWTLHRLSAGSAELALGRAWSLRGVCTGPGAAFAAGQATLCAQLGTIFEARGTPAAFLASARHTLCRCRCAPAPPRAGRKLREGALPAGHVA